MLKPIKPKSIVGSTKERTVNEKNDKIPCYLVNRTHFSYKPPINGPTPRSRNSCGLLPLSLDLLPIAIVELFVPHLHKLHEHNIRQITISKYKYQSTVEFHKRLQDIKLETRC